MAKQSGRKLKVFQAQIGFYDTVVAAPSQPAALRAWGVRQDLFASGQARVTDNAQAVAAALANPETPQRRVVGTTDPFELNPTGLPTVPDAPTRAAIKLPPAASSPKLVAPPPDRTPLNAAEAELRRVDDDRNLAEADLRQRQDALDAERATAQDSYVEDRKRATATIVEARQLYRQRGGTD